MQSGFYRRSASAALSDCVWRGGGLGRGQRYRICTVSVERTRNGNNRAVSDVIITRHYYTINSTVIVVIIARLFDIGAEGSNLTILAVLLLVLRIV